MFETVRPLSANLVKMTSEIVSAYVTRNHVSASEIPALLNNVHVVLTSLVNAAKPIVVEVEFEKLTPAQIRKSVRPDGIVSFIDGKAYKTLKRHLTSHGLDPRSYCKRYGLPADYPMVASNYAERRSALAKAIGLGKPGPMADRALRGRKAG